MSAAASEPRISIGSRRMHARLYLPAGQCLSSAILHDMVTEAGVCFGLDVEVMRQAAEPHDQDRTLVIARGRAARRHQSRHLAIDPPYRNPDVDQGLAVEAGTRIGGWTRRSAKTGMGVDGQPLPIPEGEDPIPPSPRLSEGLAIQGEAIVVTRSGALHIDDEGCWGVLAEVPEPQPLEQLRIVLSPDGLEATLSLPPGAFTNANLLRSTMMDAGVCFGIDEEACRRALVPGLVPRRLLLARGKPPLPGSDGSIAFDIPTTLADMVEADGSIDFKAARTLKEVVPGTLLAHRLPPEPGRAGMAVTGQTIDPPVGQSADLERLQGEGTQIDPADPDRLIAAVEGIITKAPDGRLQVHEVYVIPGNLDLSTGSIITDRPVIVRGDIKQGFSLKSHGDITVTGLIEDARVSAQGNLIVEGGILPGKNRVKAHGDLICRFADERLLKARNIMCKTFLRRVTVEATESVTAGDIVGGRFVVGGDIKVKELGNHVELLTDVQVGVNPWLQTCLSKVHEERSHLRGEVEELVHQTEALRFEALHLKAKMETHIQLKATKAGLEHLLKRLQEYQARLSEIDERRSLHEEGYHIATTIGNELAEQLVKLAQVAVVEVEGTVWGNVHVGIGTRLRMINENAAMAVRFRLEPDSIVVEPLRTPERNNH